MAESNEISVKKFFQAFSCKNSPSKDAEEFEKLVKTYIDKQKWVTQPLVLSPTVCAQYGWKCISSTLLECVTCRAKLCTPEPQIELYKAYKACIYKTLGDLKMSHKTHCPWPLAPSPENFVNMIPMSKEESLKHFSQRIQLSLQFSASYPNLKEDFLERPEFSSQHIAALSKFQNVAIGDKEFSVSAVCLAATGWTLTSPNNKSSRVYFKCDNCQRSIWANSFNQIEKLEDADDHKNSAVNDSPAQNRKRQFNSVDESPHSKFKRLKKDDFDPLSEHRPWCLWAVSENSLRNLESNVSEETHEATSALPGWKIFMWSLLKNVCTPHLDDTENNPTKEKIRTVRNLLETWNEAVQ